MARTEVRKAELAHWLLAGVFILVVTIPSIGWAQDWLLTVRQGDSLWKLSEIYLKDVSYYQRLQQYNGITTPRGIQPGSVLRIPIAWLKHRKRSALLLWSDYSETPEALMKLLDPHRPRRQS